MPPAETRTFDWNETCEAVEDAFRRLPIEKSEDGSPTLYETLIPGMGRQLVMMTAGRAPKTVAPKKGLRALANASAQMAELLDSLPPTALAALGFNHADRRRLAFSLRVSHARAKVAKVSPSAGQPRKRGAAEIAQVVGQHYYGLTGQRPTVRKNDGKAYGPFLDFLAEIFGILGVDASAESQGSRVARTWKPPAK